MAGMIVRSVVGLGIGGAVLATAVMATGCATSQELASLRQDIQKEVQDVRTKHEQSVSQSESK